MLVATDLDTFHKSLDSYLSQPGLFDKMCHQRRIYNLVLYQRSLKIVMIERSFEYTNCVTLPSFDFIFKLYNQDFLAQKDNMCNYLPDGGGWVPTK